MMYLKRHFLPVVLLLTLALAACQPIAAPAEQTMDADGGVAEAMPIDPAIQTGTLDNGLTYYIRHNDEPMNRAELYLAINAGSILEEDDQQGLAHFLEHMLFNGTENFPGNGVIDFLESIGMAFGPDVNAYTSFDETVYTIQVPTNDEEALENGFLVLSDWAARATIDADEVESERGVVVEEWRLDLQSAGGRIQQELIPFLLADSRYAERLPIGDVEVVRTAPAERLRDFYEAWYRPNLMAVIAVGDFDEDKIEALIREYFGELTNPADAPERASYDVPEQEGTRYLVVGDPEETTTSITYLRGRPFQPFKTTEDARNSIIANLFYTMFNDRLDEIAREANSPFLSVGAGSGVYVRTMEVDGIWAESPDGRALDALEAIMTEVERVRRHGFTESELARAKAEELTFFQQLYNERDNTNSADLANEYVRNFLEEEAIPGIAYEYAQRQEMIPQITLTEVNERVADLVATDNRMIYVTGPEKETTPLPAEADLAVTVERVVAQDIAPYEDAAVASELLLDIPEPVTVLMQDELPELGVTRVVLENGVTILMKPTNFKADEIVVNGVSVGGASLVEDEDYVEAILIDDIVNESGLGEFTASDLVKVLSGKNVSVAPYIRELAEGFEGVSSPADIETLMQLIYLAFTAPRADESAFEVVRAREISQLANRAQDPNAARQDALFDALYGETVRRGAVPLEEVEALDLARGIEIYQERFADASDFTFVFVGNFELDELTALAQIYLGNLPTVERTESYRDTIPELSTQAITREVYAGEGEQSIVNLVFTGAISPTLQNSLVLNATMAVLDIMIREDLRESRGGIYASGVYPVIYDEPESNYLGVIAFGTDPERVDEMVDAAFFQVAELQTNGPSVANLTKVKAQLHADHEEDLESNGYWAARLKDFVIWGEDELGPLYVEEYSAAIDAVTESDIQLAAQEYLRDDQYVLTVLYPAAAESQSE